jgi:hypothetical protein
MSFAEIQTKLKTNFAGAGGVALDSYAGSMSRLSVATSNASETIGTALLGALVQVTGSRGVDGLISKIDTLAKGIGAVVTQIGNMVGALNGSEAQKAFSPGFIVSGGRAGSATVAPTGAGNMAMSVQSQDLQKSTAMAKKKAELEAIKRNKELEKLAKAQAAAALATVKAKKDQVALDKAALALNKDVFDIEAIQLNAAMINTTQQLGKVTSQTQLLALTNDLARLRIKQDMLDLEDAISRKDVEAATAAAARLNKDLTILGTLNNQAIKLADIKGILAQIAPKSLIDITNLDSAIAKIKEMLALQGTKVLTGGSVTGGGSVGGSSGSTVTVTPSTGDYVAPVDKATAALASIDAIIEYADAATARANAFADLLDMQTAAANAKFTANQAAFAPINLNFNAPIYTVSDQEFAANVQKAIQNQNRFGNNLDYAGGLGN